MVEEGKTVDTCGAVVEARHIPSAVQMDEGVVEEAGRDNNMDSWDRGTKEGTVHGFAHRRSQKFLVSFC